MYCIPLGLSDVPWTNPPYASGGLSEAHRSDAQPLQTSEGPLGVFHKQGSALSTSLRGFLKPVQAICKLQESSWMQPENITC